MYQTQHIDDIFSKCRDHSLPMEIELSIIDFCNRKCSFCPKRDESVAPNTRNEMSPILYRKIARELKEIGFDGLVMLCGYGEPLANLGIVDVVKHFSFTFVDIVTNGDFLTERLCRDLVDAGVNKILISIYDDRDVEKFALLSNHYPKNIVVRDRTSGFKSLTNRAGTLNKSETTQTCYYPFYMLMVDWNGDAYACCQDWNRRFTLGNLSYQSVMQVWNSRNIQLIRNMLRRGERTMPPCKHCNVHGMMRGKENFEVLTK